MTKLTEAIKKEITKDWATCFPAMGIYKPLWLMRRVGPLLEGICLNRDSSNERYQPIFHVHSLARVHPSVSLTLSDGLRTARNDTPEKIRVAFHKERYIAAAKRMNAQALLPLEGHLKLSNVLAAYEAYMKRPLAKYSVLLFEDVITTLVWCGRDGDAREALTVWTEEITTWPSSVASLQRVGGVEQWNQKCNAWIQNPAMVRATVDAQITAHSVGYLPTSEII